MAQDYDQWQATWKTIEFRRLNIDEMNDFAQEHYKKLLKMSRDYKVGGGVTRGGAGGARFQEKDWQILGALCDRVDTFRRLLPLIESLHNPHLRARHWAQIQRETEKTFEHDMPTFTLDKILDLHLFVFFSRGRQRRMRCLFLSSEENIPIIMDISDNASKEYAIEKRLEAIRQVWSDLNFDTVPHRTNVYKIKYEREHR